MKNSDIKSVVTTPGAAAHWRQPKRK